MTDLESKHEALRGLLSSYGRAAVAFSGGTDSSLLCAVAHDVLGDGALAITVVSPMLPISEREAAASLAGALGMRHILVEKGGIEEDVAANPPDRCYLCKLGEFRAMRKRLEIEGSPVLLDGSNVDDLSDYRPGQRALAELGILSPLRLAGFTKADVRELSRGLGIGTWDKPAMACLASRIPYGDRLDPVVLGRIDEAETWLRSRGFRQVRLRVHGDLGRIELGPEDQSGPGLLSRLAGVDEFLRGLGFAYVCLDLGGYRMGSLNEVLPPSMKEAVHG